MTRPGQSQASRSFFRYATLVQVRTRTRPNRSSILSGTPGPRAITDKGVVWPLKAASAASGPSDVSR